MKHEEVKVAKAASRLKQCMIFGVVLYVVLAVIKRQHVFEGEFWVIGAFSTILAFLMFAQIAQIVKARHQIANFSKLKLTMWVCGIYGFMLMVLSWLEVYLH